MEEIKVVKVGQNNGNIEFQVYKYETHTETTKRSWHQRTSARYIRSFKYEWRAILFARKLAKVSAMKSTLVFGIEVNNLI